MTTTPQDKSKTTSQAKHKKPATKPAYSDKPNRSGAANKSTGKPTSQLSSQTSNQASKKPQSRAYSAEAHAAKAKSAANAKPQPTSSLHPRNPHQGRYDFEVLTKAFPELAKYTISNPNGEPTVNFSDAKAVMTLNKALLAHHYGVKLWELPEGYLCPPIPGRADYIHQVADLLKDQPTVEGNEIPASGQRVHVLDIGVGASCIYPIIGSQSYGWRFTGTDIDPVSVNTAKAICQANPNLKNLIKIKLQDNPKAIFEGVIGPEDYFDLTVCNPPFHASLDEAMAANALKETKLAKNRQRRGQPLVPAPKNNLNFGGQQSELWTKGGEVAFITKMIKESKKYAGQVGWFTTLISKSENLKPLIEQAERIGARKVTVLNMKHGQKMTRILAWRFALKQ